MGKTKTTTSSGSLAARFAQIHESKGKQGRVQTKQGAKPKKDAKKDKKQGKSILSRVGIKDGGVGKVKAPKAKGIQARLGGGKFPGKGKVLFAQDKKEGKPKKEGKKEKKDVKKRDGKTAGNSTRGGRGRAGPRAKPTTDALDHELESYMKERKKDEDEILL